MMTIQGIIKKATKRLALEGKLLTPDFYGEAFCKEAKKAGINTEDCSHITKFKATLNTEFQKELKNYNIKTMSELTRFLISKLNRTKSSHCSTLLDSQTIFTRRVLQVVEVLHNKQASELAIKSLDLLSRDVSAAEIDQYRQLWVNFLTNYDDTFLDKLKSMGSIDTKDLQKSIENLKISNDNTKLVQEMELSSTSCIFTCAIYCFKRK